MASETIKEVYSRIRVDGLFDNFLQKVEGILLQATQDSNRLGAQTIGEAVIATTGAQSNCWSAQASEPNQTPDSRRGLSEGQMKDAGPNPAVSAAPPFNQDYIVSDADFGYDTMGDMPIPGDEWSPSQSDGVGWDWSCFSELLAEHFQPQ